MKTILILLAVIIVDGLFIQATRDNDSLPNDAFRGGETLKYELSYGFIKGGVASLQVQDYVINGRTVYHAVAIARSTGICDKLYKVKDTYECYFDSLTGLPLKSIRDVHESTYNCYNEVSFNHSKKTAVSNKTGEHQVPDKIHDIVSAFYFARRTLFDGLKLGDTLKINTFFEDKVFPLTIRYKGTQDVDGNLGKVNCLMFSPVVETGRIFDTPDDMSIWISNDENFIPIRVQFNLIVGSLRCDLISFSGLKNQLKFK